MINPIFEEQIKAGFINFFMFRLHMAGLAVITFLVFLFYPSQQISYFLARSVKPEMFNIALYTILAFIAYLTIKSAISNIQNIKFISIKDWFLYTEVTAGAYLRGRLSYGLFYTLFLNLLFLPILLVAGSISAISPVNLVSIVLFMFLITIDLYLLGFFFFVISKKQHWMLTLIIWVTVLFIVFLSPHFFPENHLMLLFVNLQKTDQLGEDLSVPLYIWTGVTSLLLGSIGTVVYSYYRKIHD